MPRHNAQASICRRRSGRLTVGGDLAYSSSSSICAATKPICSRQSTARTIVEPDGSYAVGKRIRLAARVTNLFDAEYSTFGLLGEADDVLGDAYDDPRFLSPGAPRAAWVGIELVFR